VSGPPGVRRLGSLGSALVGASSTRAHSWVRPWVRPWFALRFTLGFATVHRLPVGWPLGSPVGSPLDSPVGSPLSSPPPARRSSAPPAPQGDWGAPRRGGRGVLRVRPLPGKRRFQVTETPFYRDAVVPGRWRQRRLSQTRHFQVAETCAWLVHSGLLNAAGLHTCITGYKFIGSQLCRFAG
jgi:hypothetical protein